MKKYLLFLILLPLSGISQEWAPIGAKWYYTEYISMTSNEVGFIKIEVEKDTIIQGRNCKKLIGNFDDCGWHSPFLTKSNDTVYFYNIQNQKFDFLYDFGAKEGDIWKIVNITSSFGGDSDTTILIVDSVNSLNISNYDLRVIYTRQVNEVPTGTKFYFGGEIIENIGASRMFPYLFSCDPIPGKIRCYEDLNLSFHITDTLPCDYTSNIQSIEFERIIIYPNPTKNYIYFSSLNSLKNAKYSILDVNGRIVLEGVLTQDKIDVSFLYSGLFYIRITNKNVSSIFKIIKS